MAHWLGHLIIKLELEQAELKPVGPGSMLGPQYISLKPEKVRAQFSTKPETRKSH